MADDGARLTGLGKFLSIVLILGLIGLGVYVVTRKDPGPARSTEAPFVGGGGPRFTAEDLERAMGEVVATAPADNPSGAVVPGPPAPEVVEPLRQVPRLAAASAFVPQDGTLEIELSEYAGYAGLIVANNGLEPNEDSWFFRNHGFKVRLTLSEGESESWSALNSGKMAASATTVDVLAAYGRQFQVVVPVQIAFSRGADGIVVRTDITRINALQGRTLATTQFTEADFFLRYLAQEAGLEVAMLPSLNAPPDPQRVNVVYTADTFEAGDLFLNELLAGRERLAGCVTWAPKTTEVAEGSEGRAHILTTNRNLLIIADILIVNRGFAQQHPEMVAGLVDGVLNGNRLVRDDPEPHLDLIARSFNTLYNEGDEENLWDAESTRDELSKVHLSNLPENLAFFSGAIDAAGSFGGIFQSAVLAYGRELVPNPAGPDQFIDVSHLQALETEGSYRDQKIAIAPIRTRAGGDIEENPLLAKDIRFHFIPNSGQLDLSQRENLDRLASIKELLQVSPGSFVMLRGHVDESNKAQFRAAGEEAFRTASLRAMALSNDRAEEIKRLLIERHQIDGSRLGVAAVGWEEPIARVEPTDPPDVQTSKHQQNRRVEVQWFTVE